MKPGSEIKLAVLAILMLLLWGLGSMSDMSTEERQLWDRVRAAQLHLYQWKQRYNADTDTASDPWQCGLIGVEWSGTTTTLGDLRSKRTACHPAWAVQFRRWFEQQGLASGDRIAIYSSASFPGLLLSAIAATESLQLEPLLVVSLGASTWGANEPDYPWPVLASELRRSGYIHTQADYYTLGGDTEMGGNLAEEGIAILRQSADDAGVTLLSADKLASMVSLKYDLLKDFAPGMLISIGGSHANMGDNLDVLSLSTGPVPASEGEFSGNGVIGAALRDRIPVIHMLNIKHLAALSGIPYDSAPLRTGPGGHNTWFSIIGLLLFFIVIFRHRRWSLKPMETKP